MQNIPSVDKPTSHCIVILHDDQMWVTPFKQELADRLREFGYITGQHYSYSSRSTVFVVDSYKSEEDLGQILTMLTLEFKNLETRILQDLTTQ